MSELTYRTAWQRRDPQIERDAEKFWLANNALPLNTSAEARLSELCAAAYSGDQMVAVSTASIRTIGFLRCKLAMFRVLVAPDLRIQEVASKLAVYSRDLLEAWSKENPDQGVMGLGAVIQSRVLVKNIPEAVYPDTKLAFIGYTQEGYQMRVYWFAHATVSDYWPGDDTIPPAGREQL
jgi:hypothetical protein